MAAIHPPLPLMNRLLTIAQEEAAKMGHDVRAFTRRMAGDDPIYVGECSICGAEAEITCTTRKYNRTGAVYASKCKPG